MRRMAPPFEAFSSRVTGNARYTEPEKLCGSVVAGNVQKWGGGLASTQIISHNSVISCGKIHF